MHGTRRPHLGIKIPGSASSLVPQPSIRTLSYSRHGRRTDGCTQPSPRGTSRRQDLRSGSCPLLKGLGVSRPQNLLQPELSIWPDASPVVKTQQEGDQIHRSSESQISSVSISGWRCWEQLHGSGTHLPLREARPTRKARIRLGSPARGGPMDQEKVLVHPRSTPSAGDHPFTH